MVDQMGGMKGRFPRYNDYAQATLAGTLSPAERKLAYVAQAVTFASAYLENLGSGKFALRPLPLAAQIAPVFGMLAGDYDGDGNLDVLLVGNSHAGDTQTGWGDGPGRPRPPRGGPGPVPHTRRGPGGGLRCREPKT